MNLQSQPTPNAPAPRPSEAALLSQRKWGWLKGAGIASILIFALAVLTAPMMLRSRKKGDGGEALSNARKLGLALFEFEQEYGKFPDESTISEVRDMTGSTLDFGNVSSNDFFRQLLGAGITGGETMFYAKIDGTRKPDNVFDVAGEALKKGECGFTYFLGARHTDNPNRPLAVAAMMPGTDRFDRKRFDGRAVILRMDNTAMYYNIDKDGHVIFEGRNLMDPAHPVWDGHAPTIAWPDL